MNEAPIKHSEASQPGVAAEQRSDLTTPHFDDSAVATAQPVEPIAPPVYNRRWAALLERPRMLLAIVFITVMMGITALAFTLQSRYQPHVDTAATEILDKAATELQTEQTAATESEVIADTEPPKSRPRRAKQSKVRARGGEGNSRPVARRVGVIYGRSNLP